MSMPKSNYLHLSGFRVYTSGMKQSIPIPVRPSEEERKVLQEAAALEDIPGLATYVRRAALQYTREHHPELFERS